MLRFHSKLAELQSNLALTDPPPRYQEWIDHWFGGGAGEFEASDREIAHLFEVTLRRVGHDLAQLSDEALAVGLDRLLDREKSRVCYRIRYAAIPLGRKANCVKALSCLYNDVFATRQAPPVADLCLRLWEVCDLAAWPTEDPDGPVTEAVLQVLGRALSSLHPTIAESARRGVETHIPLDRRPLSPPAGRGSG